MPPRKLAVTFVVAAYLSGCAATGGALTAAEGASSKAAHVAEDYLCNRISMRQWRESFGREKGRYQAWGALCTHYPVTPSAVLPKPPPSGRKGTM